MKNRRIYIMTTIVILFFLGLYFILPKGDVTNDLFINEIMSSNGTSIVDEDGDSSDWIEIYNAGESKINLHGFLLSDNPQRLDKWRFPQVEIEPGDYLIIWASGKDKVGSNGEIHTNFSISSSGEPIILTMPDTTTIVDMVDAVTIPRNRSYGRKQDGGQEWSFFNNPTPGYSNEGESGFTGTLQPPTFSKVGGFYDEAFTLELYSEDNADIYFTLDGSEPTENSIPYDGPIEIKPEILTSDHPIQRITADNPPQSPISFIETASPDLYEGWGYDRYKWHPPTGNSLKGTVVRAIAIKEGSLPSEIATNTYFVDEDIQNRFNMPVISISTDMKNLFDYDEGIYILGRRYDNWRRKNPDENVLGNAPANYNREGSETEKAINIEFYEVDGSLAFSQSAGLRTHGGFTRGWAQKALRIYARRIYDEDSYFHHEIFPGLKEPESNETLQQFKRLILRASGNDWSYTLFRDGLIQSLVKDFKMDTQAYRPAVVYINGEYWGIHNIRERLDKDYLATHYNLDRDNVSIIEIRELDKAPLEDSLHYINMINYIKENDITQKEHYEYIKTQMDIENFIDYHITGIYIANTDWLENNVQFWRLKTDEYKPNSPYGHDGRWRWALYDTDMAFDFDNTGMYRHNTLEWATTHEGEGRNAPEYTFLLRSLLTNEEFRNQFINRFADHMNTAFRTENVLKKIDEIQSHLRHEMQYNIQRWPNFGSMEEWHENIEVLRRFAKERPEYMKQYIVEHFDLDGMANVIIELPNPEVGKIQINTTVIDIANAEGNRWQGVYYQGVPIQITAIPQEGHKFLGWEGSEVKDNTLNIELTQDIVLKPIFK